jgi:hypothetical protein
LFCTKLRLCGFGLSPLPTICQGCDFHLEISDMWYVKRLKIGFGIETSSVNEAHNHSTTPTSGNYFRTSWRLIKKTTHTINWKCRIFKNNNNNNFNFTCIYNNVKCKYNHLMHFLLSLVGLNNRWQKYIFLYEELSLLHTWGQ